MVWEQVDEIATSLGSMLHSHSVVVGCGVSVVLLGWLKGFSWLRLRSLFRLRPSSLFRLRPGSLFRLRRLAPVERQLYTKLYASLDWGVLVFDAQHKILFANPCLTQIFPSFMVPGVFFDALSPLFSAPHARDCFETLEKLTLGRAKGCVSFFLMVERTPVMVTITTEPFGDDQVVWFWHMNTASTIETLESEAFVRFMDLLETPLLVTSSQGDVQHANKAFLDWTGYHRSELIARPLERLVNEKLDFSPNTLPLLVTFSSFSGHQRPAVVSQVYPLGDGSGSLCLFLQPQLASLDQVNPLATLLDALPMAGVFLDHRGVVRLANRSFEKILRDRKILGRPLKAWVEEDAHEALGTFFVHMRRDKMSELGVVLKAADKSPAVHVKIHGSYLTSLGWDPYGCFLLVFYDVTDGQKREAQILESQKLQALGQLASGISHDFNNLLTAMMGFCDLLLQKHSPQDGSFNDIMQIKQNANRAANLVRQLLLFAKQSLPNPVPLDVRESLNEMAFLLRRLIGPKIDLHMRHDRGSRMIYGDLGQFEQIIMNLAINARDAMSGGGELVFTTQAVVLKEPLDILGQHLSPKSYVVVDVQDTGCGISAENIEKIFLPFFSTKASGRGTGLGLATVYQIIDAMGGGIDVHSTLGQGTTFRLYIPRHMDKKKPSHGQEEDQTQGQLMDFWEEGQILIVEDEDPVRLFAARALRSKGYEVWEAKDGMHGFEILQKNPSISLLITDVMMPGMDGPTLVNAAHSLNPLLKVMFVSGYPEDDIQTKLHFPKEQVCFLPKPFNLNELAVKVHDVLGRM